jgi:SAM-dependent methyltransferase
VKEETVPHPSLHPDNASEAGTRNGAPSRHWGDYQRRHDEVLRPISERLLVAADAKPGELVVDVGCGCGTMTIDFAARVAPDGEVLGIDISEPMLARARERAEEDCPARFVRADPAVYELPPGEIDLVVSRFGVTFFADPAQSFANLRRGMKAGGRLALACLREASQNPWLSVPLSEASKHAARADEAGGEEPDLFAFALESRVQRILSEAGFSDVVLTPEDLDLDIALGEGLEAAVAAALTIGPTGRMLERQSEAVRAAAAADIRAALSARAVGDSVPLGASVWIVTARNPA